MNPCCDLPIESVATCHSGGTYCDSTARTGILRRCAAGVRTKGRLGRMHSSGSDAAASSGSEYELLISSRSKIVVSPSNRSRSSSGVRRQKSSRARAQQQLPPGRRSTRSSVRTQSDSLTLEERRHRGSSAAQTTRSSQLTFNQDSGDDSCESDIESSEDDDDEIRERTSAGSSHGSAIPQGHASDFHKFSMAVPPPPLKSGFRSDGGDKRSQRLGFADDSFSSQPESPTPTPTQEMEELKRTLKKLASHDDSDPTDTPFSSYEQLRIAAGLHGSEASIRPSEFVSMSMKRNAGAPLKPGRHGSASSIYADPSMEKLRLQVASRSKSVPNSAMFSDPSRAGSRVSPSTKTSVNQKLFSQPTPLSSDDSPVGNAPQGSRAVLSALKALQDKIRRLEDEREKLQLELSDVKVLSRKVGEPVRSRNTHPSDLVPFA